MDTEPDLQSPSRFTTGSAYECLLKDTFVLLLKIGIEGLPQRNITELLDSNFATRDDLLEVARIKGKRNANGHMKLAIQNKSHNHEPSMDLARHPFARILLEEEVQDIGNLNRLKDKYEQWPQSDKENAQVRLSELVASPRFLSFEPKVQHDKERQPSKRKKKGSSSTVRDPSQFERVEAALKSKTHEDFRVGRQPSQMHQIPWLKINFQVSLMIVF
ncbi:hypothetical protein ACH5RR_036928 [Cinchona calisaya]|uniref:Uncharacterized protein n=1 Tax=Cinchona calisaya TaxID=153742 RepID=A0ABD2Y8A0_9GENT